MNSAPERPPLHPMLWVAAASVTALSLAGVAKLTGLIPDSPRVETPPVVSAPAAPAPVTPVAPPAQIAAAEPPADVAPPKPAVEPVKPPPPRHKPAPPREHPDRHVAQADSRSASMAPNLPPYVPPVSALPPPPPVCHECGTIESVEAIQQKGEGSGIGAVGGAILGGVLGNQVGEGSGKKLARIGGAVLGGFAGNEAERRARTVSHYQVTVRMEDGTRRVITEQQAPAWRQGDPVRVRNGEIIAAGGRSNF